MDWKESVAFLVTALVGGWTLCLLYEAPVLYAMAEKYSADGAYLNYVNQFFLAMGFFAGAAIKGASATSLKKTHLLVLVTCFAVSSCVMFFPQWWGVLFPVSALLGGIGVALCAHLVKASVRKTNWRLAAPVVLVLGTLFLVCTHFIVSYGTARAGFVFSQFILAMAIFLLCRQVPHQNMTARNLDSLSEVLKKFRLLYIFIALISFNSGIMFHALYPLLPPQGGVMGGVLNIPYIAAVICLSFFYKGNKYLLLHLGLIVAGAALIAFTCFGEPVVLPVILVLHFVAGTFDLFWWTIGTTCFGLVRNPVTIFGSILGVNILGVLAGGVCTYLLSSRGIDSHFIVQGGIGSILLTTFLLNLVNKQLSPFFTELDFLEQPQWTAPDDEKTGAVRKRLSPREMDVFQLLRSGFRDKDISNELNISPETVKSHNRKIYAKLGLKNRVELRRQFPKGK